MIDRNVKRKRASSSFLYIIISCVIGVLLLRIFLFDWESVIGESMLPNFKDGEVVGVLKTGYELKRKDVVLVTCGSGLQKKDCIKRIIGMPNERIQIKDGEVYIDGEKLKNDIDIFIEEAGRAENEILLGADEYFVLGDNRNNSEDSRGKLGIVKLSDIKGKCVVKLKKK